MKNKYYHLLGLVVLAVFGLSQSVFAQVTSYPHVENFDALSSCGTSCTSACTLTTGGWTNGTSDDKDWVVDASGTSSSGTGPNGDHTTGTGNYIYTEASSCFNKVANLFSPVYNFSSLTNPALEFYYHMYGQTMGSLEVFVSTNGGSTWSNALFSLSGQQQAVQSNPYLKAEIPLCAYAGQSSVMIRITGTTGSDFYSDMAIDDIKVYNATSCFAPGTLNTASALGTSIDLNWTDVCAVSYDYVVVPLGSPQTATAVASGNVLTNSVNATGLSAVTSYDVYVRSNCGGSSSTWAGPFSIFSGCLAPMAGTYTVGGSSPDYATISEAINGLANCGVSAPVTINVAAGTYNEQIVLGAISGASATNTITIQGAGSSSTIVSYDGSGSSGIAFEFDGAKHVKVSDMKIVNTSSSTPAFGILFRSQADFNTIENCDIKVPTNSTSSSIIGILASGSQTSTGTAGDNANNVLIKDCNVTGGYYGIRFYGSSTAASDNLHNRIENTTVDSAYFYGIYMYYQGLPELVGNTVQNMRNSSSYGIYCGYAAGPEIHKNWVQNAGAYGMYLLNINTTTQPLARRSTIANNMVSATGTGDAVYLTGADSLNLYYNSLYADADQALWINSTSNEYDVRNNILVAANETPVDLDAVPSATDVMDYNVLYSGSGTDVMDVSTSSYASLATLQAAALAPNFNTNSLEGDPAFVGSPDLHVQGAIANDVGVVIAGITDDIDGDLRSGSTPDIGADEYAPASCLSPTAMMAANMTASTAELSWTAGGTETMWNIEYGLSGFSQGAGTVISGVTANPYTLSGLLANTSYDFYIQSDCGTGTSVFAFGATFTTACSAFSTPFAESFDATTQPNCWSSYGSDPWLFTTTWPGYGAASATDHSGNGGSFAGVDGSGGTATNDGTLESPLIDLTGLANPQLAFYVFSNNTNAPGDNATLKVEVWDGSTWTLELSYAADDLNWVQQTVNLSSYSGNIKVRFIIDQTTMTGSAFYNDIMIDDVTVDNAPSCTAPTALMVDSVNSSEAFIHWTTGGASDWLVEYGAPGFTLGSGTQIIASNDSINITGLSPNTAYEFYVADSCGLGDISSYTGPVAFNTTAFCAGTESLPYAENFDAGIGCFTAIDAGDASGDTWAQTVNTGQNLDGTGYMRVDSDANGNGTHLIETLQSPIIDASNVSTSLILEFDHYYRALGDSATVQVYDGANWVNVAVYKSSTGAWSSPSHEVIDVTAYANANFQVRFFYDDNDNWAWYWNVDNFSVEDKCLTQSLPYVENFDTDQGCFTTTDGGAASGDTWMHTTGASQNLDGTGYMRVDSDANGNGTYMREVMTSPVIDASGYAGTLMLEFDHYYRSIGSDTGWVDVWDGTAWVNVAMYTSSAGGWGAPAHEAINISAYANANLQVRFDYDDGNTWAWYWNVDNFSVVDVGCLPPSALAAFNVTTNSADVSWTTGGASNWMVEYGPSGFTLGSGTRVMASNDTITLSGLQGATSYDFYVADSCGVADISTWTGPVSFATACPSSVPAPYFTDFEGITLGNQTTFDNCWTTYGSTNPAWYADNNGTSSGGTGPNVDHTTGGAGVYMYLETSSPSSLGDTNTLYSPPIDISTLTNAQVSFWYHMHGATMGNIYVYAMDATGTRTLLDSIVGQQQPVQTDPWLQKLVDASALPSGTYRFLIEGNAGSSFTSDMAIDDFAVEEAPSCFASSGLHVVSAGNTSATVTWTAGTGTSWDVEYGPAGFMPGSGTVINSTNDTLTITGLMASTVYDFYVTDSCGSSGISSVAGPETFITSACALANQCSYVFDLYDTFGDGWNGGAIKVYQNGVQVATLGNTFSAGLSSLGNLVSLCDNQPIVVTLDPAGAWPSEIGLVVIQPNGDTAGVHVASSSVGTGDTLFSFTSNCSSCATYAAPFFESFEVSSASIACWTNEAVSDTSLAWSLGAGSTGGSISAAYAGSLNAVYVSQGPSGAADTTRMVSPVLDLSSLISPQLSFWYAQEDWFGDQNITNVYYRASATDPWTYLWGDNTSKASWTLATMSLPNPSSTYQIAIEGINNWGHANVVDSLSITDAAVVCTMPDSVAASNVTANSADISWVSSANTSSSWIEYGPAGFAPGTGTIVNPATSATTLSGLMPGTAYEACVYDICTALSDTSMAACVSFATLCAPITSYPYMEDFDNGLFPTCWSETTTGTAYTWRIDAGGTPSTNTGPAVDHTTGTGAGYYMYVEASSPAAAGDSAFLYTPEFNMTSLTNPEVVYYYHMFGVDIVNLDLQVYDRTAMTWNSINNIVGQQQFSNGDAWGEARVNLAAYTTDTALQLRFLSVRGASFDGDAAVDDVIIRETPACVDPSNLMVVTATSSSVVLAWDSDTNIIASTVQYGAPGFALGTGTNVAATPGGFTVSGLTGTTCYDFYVKDSCSTGTNWIGPVSACTIATCSVSSMPSSTINDTTDCDGGSASLMAISSTGNDLVWTVNGVVRETGDTYLTDSVPFTTSFDVSEYVTTMPNLHVGPLTNIAAAGFGNFSNGQWITVRDTIHIDSMTVRHQNDVVAFAQLWDASISNVLQRGDTFSTPAGITGDFRVPVNMVVTPGVYFMNVDFLSGAGLLFRATGGAAYPYDLPGLMSIDSTNFSAQVRIYYTFDITVSKACIGMPTQALAVVPGANAGTSDTSLVCSTDMAANMAAFLGVHDNGGTWVDNDATGANTDSILDATMLTAGNIYHFSYILAGVNGCAGDTANVYVEVEAAPFGGVNTSVAYCKGSGIKILRNLLTGTAFGGTWVDVDGSGALNTGTGVFNSNNASVGTYRINYILAGVVCDADTTTITVTIDNPVSAGVAVTDTVCDDENMVDLNNFLDASASAGGVWTDLSGTGALSANIFDATAVTNLSSYNFQYKVMSACGDDSVTVTLFVDDCDVSVRELRTGFINIYPNPTSGVIKIDDENVRGAIKVEVFAGNGQLMISEEYAEGEEIRLDISEYAVGIYTVKVNSSKGLDVKRIMKQ